MADREKILNILNYSNTKECGFWKGRPHKEALKQYLSDLKLKDEDELSAFVGDDLKWTHADSSYKHPEGTPVFDTMHGQTRISDCQPGVFMDTTSIKEIDAFPWPDLKYINLDDYIAEIKKAREDNYALLGGFWSPYFHIAADFFGMENYFIKMYTEPKIVEAVTEHIVEYYYQANKMLLEKAGEYIDIIFFGNDFGTQLDLFMSPEMFKKYVYPGVVKLTNLAKKHNKKVALHSCGSIYRVIPLLIDAGIDVLHPIQAKAKNMDAKYLNDNYKDDIIFMGGLDTQVILPFGSEKEIEDEVERLKEIFGPNFILSPSHEALLKNVSTKNLLAFANAAHKKRKE